MDKIFVPNKWFVLFCALFIGVYATLNWVISARIQARAKTVGEDIFTWVWLDKNVCSSADMSEAHVLKRDENSTTVEVSGEQTVGPFDGSKSCAVTPGKAHCQAVLTFYKSQNEWQLGRVELQ
jgi:hypothetical protein